MSAITSNSTAGANTTFDFDFPADRLMDCSKSTVKESEYGAGTFATCDIKAGEVVEYGVARVLTNIDGNENPYIFTWSDEVPNTTWATCSGTAMFYNTVKEDGSENTKMYRYFDKNRFVIVATKDVRCGDELTHVYKSKQWRKCFSDLREDACPN